MTSASLPSWITTGCRVDGCDRVAYASELCRRHYDSAKYLLEERQNLRRGYIKKTDDWLASPEVAVALCTTLGTLHRAAWDAGSPIQRKPWGRRAKSCRGCGTLWYRPDVELVAAMRRDLHLPVSTAFRILLAAQAAGWTIKPPARD